MANKEEVKERKRIVVEEVKEEETPKEEAKEVELTPEPAILEEAANDTISVESESKIETIVENKEPAEKKEPVVKEVKPIEAKKSSSIALWIIIPGIFLLGAILGGIFFYQRGVSNGEFTPTPTESTSPTSVPSASPSASVDLTKYTISIFNGSGIPGEAGKAKTLITTAGFKVGSAGNAATYDYTKTIIKAKSTVEAPFISALSAALGKTYVIDAAQTLASTSADTVQVVIGSSKASP